MSARGIRAVICEQDIALLLPMPEGHEGQDLCTIDVSFLARCFAGGEDARLAHDLDPKLAAAMAEFAERHRAPELQVQLPPPPTARERRLARPRRSLLEILGGA